MRLSLPDLAALFRSTTPKVEPRGAGTRLAAVAAVLRNLESPEILLIKRAHHPHDPWSGHMAFPGGRYEPSDPDTVATALRETREEVGIDLAASAAYLGALDDVHALSRERRIDLVIVPHVFVLATDVVPVPAPEEVEAAMWVPLGPMFRGETETALSYHHEGKDQRFPAWQVGEDVVWGLTHRMLESFFGLLRLHDALRKTASSL